MPYLARARACSGSGAAPSPRASAAARRRGRGHGRGRAGRLAPAAAVASGGEFWSLAAAPVVGGVCVAYWLAQQQPALSQGDVRDRMVAEDRARREAREQQWAREDEEAAAAAARGGEGGEKEEERLGAGFAAADGEWPPRGDAQYSLGEPVRVLSGEPGRLERTQLRLRRVLVQPSAVLVVELPRGAAVRGLELAAAAGDGRYAVVAACGREAQQAGVRRGDVVRSVSEALLQWDGASRASLRAPRRLVSHRVAPDGGVEGVEEAIRSGLPADGPLTLVLERRG